MNRNGLYLVIGVLIIVAAVAGYLLYEEKQKKAGIDININGHGISIEGN